MKGIPLNNTNHCLARVYGTTNAVYGTTNADAGVGIGIKRGDSRILLKRVLIGR